MDSGSGDKAVKVCFVMPKAYTLFNPEAKGPFGGAEVDLYIMATELAKDPAFEVDFIVADYGQQPIEQIENVRIIRSLDFKKSSLAGAIKIWKAMRLSDADIYINKTASLGAGLIARFCRRHRKLFVYRTASSTESSGEYVRQNFVKGRVFRYALRNAAAVFTQNRTIMTIFCNLSASNRSRFPTGTGLPMRPATINSTCSGQVAAIR